MGKLTKEEYVVQLLAKELGTDITKAGVKFRNLNCLNAQQLIFIVLKKLKKDGIDLKIPWYWSTHGVRLELNQLVEEYPNIIWICTKEEYMECPYWDECDFKGKFRGD